MRTVPGIVLKPVACILGPTAATCTPWPCRALSKVVSAVN